MDNRYAIIENGLVINVIVGTVPVEETQQLVPCEFGGPGWKYIDGQFVEPDPVPVVTPPAPTKEELLAQLQALQAQIQALP